MAWLRGRPFSKLHPSLLLLERAAVGPPAARRNHTLGLHSAGETVASEDRWNDASACRLLPPVSGRLGQFTDALRSCGPNTGTADRPELGKMHVQAPG